MKVRNEQPLGVVRARQKDYAALLDLGYHTPASVINNVLYCVSVIACLSSGIS